MSYGIPYQGSKSKIAKNIIALFPKADHFYDLFGGGFAITHAIILHRINHYKHFHYNEIRRGVPKLVQDAIAGKYNYKVFKPEFVTREAFFKNIEDPYIKLIWSFGNNGKDYLFGKESENKKRSLHNAVVFNDFDDYAQKIFGFDSFKGLDDITDRRLFLKTKIKNQQLQQLERLEQLQRLEQLKKGFNVKHYSKLNFYNDDYRNVKIEKNSIVYCDIPYFKTAGYGKDKNFNHKEFWDWAYNNSNPVFISEFSMPDKRFKQIFNIKKRSLMKGAKTKSKPLEKMFANKPALDLIFSNKKYQNR